MNDLFSSTHKKAKRKQPLPVRCAPTGIDDFVGQEHIVAPGRLLYRLITTDRLGSVVFHGHSGTGKTALAHIIARTSASHFIQTNAVTLTVAELRKILEAARLRRDIDNQHTTLLIDEIHHFNRTQQDALLPDVELGTVTLIGITTENPYFYVNAALLSRSQVFEFQPLSTEHLNRIYETGMKVLQSEHRDHTIVTVPEARDHIIISSMGDARRLLSALEVAVESTQPDTHGVIRVTLETAEQSIQKKAVVYDKSGDAHYDIVSAFIKSMRGSNPDAALYWIAVMLAAGEDPRFIARRIIICASEDVGNADPLALVLASSALTAVEFVGMPEARILLGQAVTYVASAPKSNASYTAVESALHDVHNNPTKSVPNHLKDANLDRESRGHGKGYRYPHDYPEHFVVQQYLPGQLKNFLYYKPAGMGREKAIKERLEKIDHLIQKEIK
ncbi:MAG: AAA family ATPase [Elusimicrobia bacterium]|nr:AAA family ATPase [Elusimicrobiota bacterium]MBD3411536.1 AAA family ATPase [Elusimicrobiota bacterium]